MKPNYLQETYLKHKNIERFKEIEKRQIISVCNLVMIYHSFAKCRRNWANYTRTFRVLFLTTVYKWTIILIEFQLEKEVRQISTKDSCGKISNFSVHQKHLETDCCVPSPVSNSVGKGWDQFIAGFQVVLMLLAGRPRFVEPWYDVMNL